MPQTYTVGAKPGKAGTSVSVVTPTGAGALSPFGTTCYVGAFRWGPMDKAISHVVGGINHYRTLRGTPMKDDYTALAIEHGYKVAGSSIRTVTYRVGDGNQTQATTSYYQRLIQRNITDQFTVAGNPALPLNSAFTLSGAFPGRRGGRYIRFGAEYPTGTYPISGNTFATSAVGWGKDAYKGFTIHFGPGSTYAFTILANDTSGNVTIDGSFAQKIDAAGTLLGTALNALTAGVASWWVSSENVNELGVTESVSLRIEEDPISAHKFRFVVGADGVDYGSYENLENGANQPRHFQSIVNSASDTLAETNIAISSDQFPASGVALTNEEYKPAGWVGLGEWDGNGWQDQTTATLGYNQFKVNTYKWSRVGSHDCYIERGTVTHPASADVFPCEIRCTFISGTNFTVAVYPHGSSTALFYATNGGAGYASATNVPLREMFGILPTFQVNVGGGPSIGNSVSLWYNPLPPGLSKKNAWFYPNGLSAEGDHRLKYRVLNNTLDTATLKVPVGSSIHDEIGAPRPAIATAPTAGPYVVAGGASDVMIFVDDLGNTRTLGAVAAGTVTATALAALLNAEVLSVLGAANLRAVFGATTVSGASHLTMRNTFSFGPGTTIGVGAGNMNTITGYVAGTTNGTDGGTAVIQYDKTPAGGRDGLGALGENNEYENAFDATDSHLNTMATENFGLVKLANPGISTPAVINAGVDYAFAAGWRYAPTLPVPATVANEAAAVAWVLANITLADDARNMMGAYWPAWGTAKINPFDKGELQVPIVGPALGLQAKYAADFNGYHRATAGLNADISTIISKLPTDDNGIGIETDDYTLNQIGLVAVNHYGPKIVLWGARSPELQGSGQIWSHKWDCLLHIAAELRVLSKKYVFEMIPDVWPEIVGFTQALLAPKYAAGWFIGGTFGEAVQIVCDTSNNPTAIQDAGKVICTVTILGIKGVAEKIEFTVGTSGVAVAIG